jgi:hypothetical protein
VRRPKRLDGADVWELEALPPEALPPEALPPELRSAIDSIMDLKLFNAELDAEKRDAVYLDGLRQRAHLALKESA